MVTRVITIIEECYINCYSTIPGCCLRSM